MVFPPTRGTFRIRERIEIKFVEHFHILVMELEVNTEHVNMLIDDLQCICR